VVWPLAAENDQSIPPQAGNGSAQNPPDVLYFQAVRGQPERDFHDPEVERVKKAIEGKDPQDRFQKRSGGA
jgi:hypothetical protein